MNATIRPLDEISQQATTILIREMGVVDALRFLSQFRAGTGDYTKERGQWLDDLSLEQIASGIKAKSHAERLAAVDRPDAKVFYRHQVMSADPAGDALHLAIASYHRCDFLLTWNCRHLANANKFAHIRRVNGILGLLVPSLVTPLELLGEPEST